MKNKELLPEELPFADHVGELIQFIGDDPNRQGLIDTPNRVMRAYREIFSGYSVDISGLFTEFESPHTNMVVLKDIEFYSMCEHHMLPFFGKAHVAYIPNKNVVGISKLARLVDAFSKRLQIQEHMGDQITEALMANLDCLGAACIIEATHLCMKMRGVKKQNSIMVTSSLTGVFRDPTVRMELLQLIH